jgi:hypothetical protein
MALIASAGSAVAANSIAVTGGAKVLATEIFGSGSDATVSPSVATVYTLGVTPVGDFKVTVNLTNAKFGANLASGNLVAANVGAGSACAGAAISLVSGGTTSDNQAVFRVTGGSNCKATDTLTLTSTLAAMSALATATNGGSPAVSVQVGLSDNLGNLESPLSTNVYTSAAGSTYTAAAGANQTIDVATGSTKFLGGATQIKLGSVTLANNAANDINGAALATWATGNPNGGGVGGAGTDANTNNTVNLTVTGTDLSAALNPSNSTAFCSSATVTTCGIFVDKNGNGTYDAGEEAASINNTTATFKLSNLPAGTYNVYMMVNTQQAIAEQTPTIAGSVTYGGTHYGSDSLSSTSLANMARNGVTKNLVFLNSTADETNGYKSYIRITNTSSVDGLVRVTLTLDDGTSNSTAALVNGGVKLSHGQTLMLQTKDIETATGVTIPSGKKARLTINGDFPSASVQNLMLSPNGTFVNMTDYQ